MPTTASLSSQTQRYRVSAQAFNIDELFVDWFDATSEADARAQWIAQAKAIGFPNSDKALLTITQS